ncbi:hypothetical protein NDU88_010039 [Pleurodeles waltl]|uniref:Uncharacterized protein n=1 Tax=Pleurodeles waltl TaxID=8319 RepID=A0AAV7Q125_PLEWA|nr:hypothetical protein NDU88_010039 [Pleurodeles waltl]
MAAHRPAQAQMAREQVKAVEEVGLLSANLFSPLYPNHSSEDSSVADNSETPLSTGIQGPELTSRLANDLL